MSASRCEPSANAIRCVPASPSTISSVFLPVCTVTPSASIFARSIRPPPSSTCTAISRGANSTTCVSPHVAQRLRAFEAEQAAADHDAPFRMRAARLHRFEILDRPVHEAAVTIVPRHRRHERARTRREHQLVVRERFAGRERDRMRGAVDRRDLRIQAQVELRMTLEEAGFDERQVVRRLAREEFRQVHAVVRRARFLAEHRDLQRAGGAASAATHSRSLWPTMPWPMTMSFMVTFPSVDQFATPLAASARSRSSASRALCSSLKRTAIAHNAVAVTVRPSRLSVCCTSPTPFSRKLAATAPTLPPAPTIPATPPSALRSMNGTSA